MAYFASVPEMPDFLGKAARIRSVADLLASAQEQYAQLHQLMTVNGQGEGDPIAAGDGKDGTAPPSYAERFTALRDGMAALLAENPDIHDELAAEALKRRKRLERELEAP